MTSELAQRAREATARREREALEAAPPALRPHLQKLQEIKRAATNGILEKNRALHDIDRYRKFIEANPEDARIVQYREHLEKLERSLPKIEQDAVRAKDESFAAEREYSDRLIEHRIAAVPASRRDEARALLLEEREAIHRANLTPAISGGAFGAAGGMYFGIELRIEAARKNGDEAAVRELLPALEEARRGKEAAEELMRGHQAKIATLQSEYEARLRSLIEP